MRTHLLQILSKKVFLWNIAFRIAETPSMIVSHRYVYSFLVVLIIMKLLKYIIHNSASKEELTSMPLWLGSQYPGWPTLAFRSHVAHQPLLSLGCKCLVIQHKCCVNLDVGVACDSSSIRTYLRHSGPALFLVRMKWPVLSWIMKLEFQYLHTGSLSAGGALPVWLVWRINTITLQCCFARPILGRLQKKKMKKCQLGAALRTDLWK